MARTVVRGRRIAAARVRAHGGALAAALIALGVGAGGAAQAQQAAGTGGGAQTDGQGVSAPPTFEEVLENPDDLDLSFRYAKAQIDRGNLNQAATTLDRMLLQRPDLHRVRLLYGIVLFRLDDLSSAKAELERVDRNALPGNLQAELDSYLKRIERRRQRTRFSATAGLGVSYETNPAASPDSGQALALGVPLDVADAEDDLSWRADGGFEVRHELQTQTPIELFGQAFASAQEHVEVDSQDIQVGAVRAGAEIRTLWLDVTPAATAGILTLSKSRFYRYAGTSLKLAKPLDGKVDAYLEASWRAESFQPIAESQTADDRSGHRATLTLGFDGQIAPTVRGDAGVAFTRKTADADFQAYTEARLFAQATAQVFRDHFVQGALELGTRDYDSNDPFVSPRARDDEFLRVRLGYGLPVPYASELTPALEDIKLVPSVEYYRQDSNIRNFEYDNVTTSLMLRQRYEF